MIQHQSPSMKVIQDFIVQGTLIGNHRRQLAHASKNSPNIIINCDDSEYNGCDTYDESTLNMFSNINTDLLLSLDYYEMDSFGRLPGKSCESRVIKILILKILSHKKQATVELPRQFKKHRCIVHHLLAIYHKLEV